MSEFKCLFEKKRIKGCYDWMPLMAKIVLLYQIEGVFLTWLFELYIIKSIY